MIKGTRKTPEYVTYTLGEDEFKSLLGIDDPNGVLTVEVNYLDKTVIITMTRTSSE